MQTIRADLDRLREYAAVLDRQADEARAAHSGLRRHQLDDDAFGEAGRSLRTPQAYRHAADSLLAQLERAEEVLTAAATALRQAVEHYEGTDADGARALRQPDLERPGAERRRAGG